MSLDLEQLILNVGYIGLFAIVFAESGLFFGFFLPGDSLLLTAGLLAAPRPGYPDPALNIVVLLLILFPAAVLGDTVGYWFGAKAGPPLFKREESLFFKPKNLLAAKGFYDKHGGKTITLARFMPFIRTFAPIVAGAVGMEYRRFLLFNFLGGVVWAIGMTLLGYYLGAALGHVEGIDKYFTLLVLAFFFIPGLPTVVHLWRDNKEKILDWVKDRLGRKSSPEA